MNELTLEILHQMMERLPPEPYPKRLCISHNDYLRFRKGCDAFGILPELRPKVSPGFGMEIVPDENLEDKEYRFDFQEEI